MVSVKGLINIVHYNLYRFYDHELDGKALLSVKTELLAEITEIIEDTDKVLAKFNELVPEPSDFEHYIIVQFSDDYPVRSVAAFTHGYGQPYSLDCVEHDLRVAVSVAFRFNDDIISDD